MSWNEGALIMNIANTVNQINNSKSNFKKVLGVISILTFSLYSLGCAQIENLNGRPNLSNTKVTVEPQKIIRSKPDLGLYKPKECLTTQRDLTVEWRNRRYWCSTQSKRDQHMKVNFNYYKRLNNVEVK